MYMMCIYIYTIYTYVLFLLLLSSLLIIYKCDIYIHIVIHLYPIHMPFYSRPILPQQRHVLPRLRRGKFGAVQALLEAVSPRLVAPVSTSIICNDCLIRFLRLGSS